MILKCAALIDPATPPFAKGPVDTRKFMEDIGHSWGS
jgi:hypothetical protein